MAFNIPSPTISEVFQGNYPFYVPKYQRGYAWEEEEVLAFIDDIVRLVDDKNAKPHFMGGIVHINVPTPNVVSRRLEVVDGQQRMATIYLAVACLVNILEEMNGTASSVEFAAKCEVHREQISDSFLFYKDIVEGERRPLPKLSLSACDDEFFQVLVSSGAGNATRESHRLIMAAYKRIRKSLVDKYLVGKAEGDRLDLVNLIYKTIADRCFVIHIVSANRKEAYRLFAVLNDRGRSLSAGDLLRATTLENFEGKAAKQAGLEKQWDLILAEGADRTEKFLRAYYPSVTGERAPAKDLFGTYRERFLSGTKGLALRTEQLVKSMYDDKPIYELIRLGDWPYHTSKVSSWHRDRLFRLVTVLRHEAAHPLLMSATQLSEAKFSEIVVLLELFVFRYISVCKQHPSPIYAIYNSESEKIRSNSQGYSVDGLRKRLRELIELKAGDVRFVESLSTNLQYSDNTAVNRELRHFLTTLESFRRSIDRKDRKLKPDTMIVHEISNTTIEHIYSRTSSGKLIDPAMESVKDYLGNLTVMSGSDNSTLGSPSFSIKKKEFAKSPIGLTSELAQSASWGKQEFDIRVKRINDLALKLYSL